jgi:hypothetical protein
MGGFSTLAHLSDLSAKTHPNLHESVTTQLEVRKKNLLQQIYFRE